LLLGGPADGTTIVCHRGGGKWCRHVPVLQDPIGVEVAFTVVDPLQRVTGAIKSQEFEPLVMSDDGTFILSREWDLLLLPGPIARLEWLQELHHGADALSQIGECDLLLPCPDASAGMHGG
jgi:hypothetical protein